MAGVNEAGCSLCLASPVSNSSKKNETQKVHREKASWGGSAGSWKGALNSTVLSHFHFYLPINSLRLFIHPSKRKEKKGKKEPRMGEKILEVS
jgi:hypothetical protein